MIEQVGNKPKRKFYQHRHRFYYLAGNLFIKSQQVFFSLADRKIIELNISSLTVANTSYTLLRQTDSKKAKEI